MLARFVDGAPAIIRRRHGQGQAILMATHLDIAVAEHDQPAARQLFANLMTMCEVTPHVQLKAADMAYVEKHVDAHLLELGSQWAVLINNEGESDVDLQVQVPRAVKASKAIELFSQRSIPLTSPDGANFAIHLPVAEGLIIMLQ